MCTLLAVAASAVAEPAYAQTAEPGAGGQLDSVTVRARRIDERFESTASTLTVGREDIEATGGATVADVLKSLPGLQVTTGAGGNVEIRMRGMGPQGTRILVDGVQAGGNQRDQMLPIEGLSADLIERIEIQRSPSAEREGAAGGTVNIVLKQARARRETRAQVMEQRVRGADAQSMSASQSGPLGEGGSEGGSRWSYLVALSGGRFHIGTDSRSWSSTSAPGVRSTERYVDDHTRLRNEQWNLAPRITGRLGSADQLTLRGLLSLNSFEGSIASNGSITGAAGSATTSALAPMIQRRNVGQLALDWNHRFAASRLESTLWYERGNGGDDRRRDAASSDPAVEPARTSGWREQRSERSLNARTRWLMPVGAALWTVGAEAGDARLDVDSESFSDGVATPLDIRASVRHGAAWAQHEWPIERLDTTMALGLRAQHHAVRATGSAGTADASYDYLQPSLNARTRLDEGRQLRWNLARIARAPRVWEIVDRQLPGMLTNTASSPDFQGNPALRPETTLALDAGLEQRIRSGGQAGVGVFVRDQHDVIARRLALQSGRWVERPDNVGDALVWGLESDLRTDLAWAGLPSDWTLAGNFNLYQSRMRSGDAIGSRIPGQARSLSNLTIARPQRASGGWFGGGTLVLTGAADLDQPSADGTRITGRQQSFATLDLHVGSVLPGIGWWRIQVWNVTDFRRESRRTIVESNGTVTTERSAQTMAPRFFLTVGTAL